MKDWYRSVLGYCSDWRCSVVGGVAAAGVLAAGLDRARVVGPARSRQATPLVARMSPLAADRPAAASDRCCGAHRRMDGHGRRFPWAPVQRILAGRVVFWPLALGLLVVAARMFQQRPYVVLWLVGLFFWLAALQWLRLPHWATGFGWLALSLYFAFYLPVFVGLSRVAVHRLRVPVIVAAPVVWTGLELARAHLLTGMTMASLGHTQYRWIELIQISDLAGAFGVSFVVMFVAACLARMIPSPGGTTGELSSGRWCPPSSCWRPCWATVTSAPRANTPRPVPASH